MKVMVVLNKMMVLLKLKKKKCKDRLRPRLKLNRHSVKQLTERNLSEKRKRSNKELVKSNKRKKRDKDLSLNNKNKREECKRKLLWINSSKKI